MTTLRKMGARFLGVREGGLQVIEREKSRVNPVMLDRNWRYQVNTVFEIYNRHRNKYKLRHTKVRTSSVH